MAYNLLVTIAGAPALRLPISADSMIASSATRFKQVCPSCVEPVPLKQVNECPHGHGTFTKDEVAKAHPVGRGKKATLVPFSRSEVAAYADCIPEDRSMEVELHAHPAEQVHSSGMIPGPKGYWLGVQHEHLDNPKAAEAFGFLYHLVAHQPDDGPSVVWMAHVRISQSIAVYRLDITADGQLVMTELIHPTKVKEAPKVDFDADKAAAAAARMYDSLVEVEDLDLSAYEDTTLAQIEAHAAEKIAKGELTFTEEDEIEGTPAMMGSGFDLMAELEASIDAKRPDDAGAAHPAKKAAAAEADEAREAREAGLARIRAAIADQEAAAS